MKKLAVFCRFLWLIRPFTRPCHCSLFEPCESSTQPHPAFLKSILILTVYLHVDLPSCRIYSCFPTKIIYAFLSSFWLQSNPHTHPALIRHVSDVWCCEQIIVPVRAELSPFFCRFFPHGPKYSPLKYRQLKVSPVDKNTKCCNHLNEYVEL
jgi:hypothetical protein